MLHPVKVTFKNQTYYNNENLVQLESDLSIITDMLDNETDQSKEFVRHIHDMLTETIYNTYFKHRTVKIPFEKIGLNVPQQSTYIIEPIYQPIFNITMKPKIIWSNEKVEKNKYRE